MAHRKPLGTTCWSHFAKGSWDRDPELGDCLRSEAGTCYLILGIEEGPKRYRYLLERIAEPREGSWVFDFYWLPRNRSSTSTTGE